MTALSPRHAAVPPDASKKAVAVTAVLGPTNTGKTHLAMERLMGHQTGMVGFPLRLLARENYDRVVKAKGAASVALITGEEKIIPRTARYFVCTVESMPLDRPVAFLAVDEIQLAADPERGHVFTDRLLRARGLSETMFMGSDTAARWIRSLVPGTEFLDRPRLSTLSYSGAKKITRLPPRSAVVAFSATDVYAIADLIRRQRGGAAIVMGALSPRTRNAQVALYQSGEVDYLVATDAIGMGLNMDVRHVAFASLRKFDGRVPRPLTKAEIGQIAGRAGRHMTDGTFGTTADAGEMEADVVEAVEAHRFDPLPHLMWRNADLDFRSVERLLRSLEARPAHPGLIRQQEGEDHLALQYLARDPEIVALAQDRARVALLWEVCQIPDFRKLMADAHVRLLGQMFRHLTAGLRIPGRLPVDWVAGQLAQLDRTDGDIDQLTQRLAHIRTWAYVAHRGDWIADPGHWQGRAQAIEERLSDALHDALTQRFIDKRHAALHRHLQSGGRLYGVVTESDEVLVEGHAVGTLRGFAFTPLAEAADFAGRIETKPLLAAARRALGPAVAQRVGQVVAAPDEHFRLNDEGRLQWNDAVIARLIAGDAPLKPQIQLLHDDLLDGRQRQAIEQRLKQWLTPYLRRRLKPLFAAAEASLPPSARGLAYQLVEHLGAMPRSEIAPQLAALSREERQQLSSLGLRIGRETVWVQRLNDRRQRRLLLLLHAVHRRLKLPIAPLPELAAAPVGMDDATARVGGRRLIAGHVVDFGRLERWSGDLHRLAEARRLDLADETLPTQLNMPAALIAPVLRALGFVPKERGGASGFARRRKRQAQHKPDIDPRSPFAVLAGLKAES
ncbi:helicase-related protein [Dongia soli]|uniref:Helicase-related protein n=1 Tax=Dongia soli TaxID=600628 RepID=A0ABU5E7M6_9PROT|nr:helicase-related protein [Dongia soli]MDY0882188.1 helicase-related protein [Dongia soli]